MTSLYGKQALFTLVILFSATSHSTFAAECADRNAMSAAMSASQTIMGGNSFKKPRVLKRHHPSKRKEVATYFKSGDLYYTLYWIVSDNCTAGFIKRTQGKR